MLSFSRRLRLQLALWLPVVALAAFSGCAETRIAPNVPCPPRPELEAIEPQLQQKTPPEVLIIMASNQIKLKQHIKLLEVYCEAE